MDDKLGFFPILLITINSIMGTGIFFLPAVGARELGLFSIVSWIIMSLVAIYYSMIFAELIGMYPREGGVYEYAKEAFGTFPSFLLGWMTLIAANVTIAMLVVGAILYLNPVIPSFILVLVSILFICIFNYMAFKGLKTGAVMLMAFAMITLLSVLGIMIPGLLHFNTANFTGWFSHAAVSGLSFPADSFSFVGIIFVGIFLISETFFGWETATFLAEKVKNPRKVMPRVMILATVLIAIFAVLFVIASISILGTTVLGASVAPLSDLAVAVYGSSALSMFRIFVYLAIIGSVAGWIVSSPNLIVALAKDKLFIPQLSVLHKKNGTPYKAIIFQAIFTSFLVILGAGSYETLLHLLVPLVLVLYSSVVVALLVIRHKHKDVERPFTAPGGSWGPILLIMFTLSLIVMWTIHSHGALSVLALLFSFILFGVPLYLLLLFYYNPDATLRFKNQTAVFAFFLERFFFPDRIQKEFMLNGLVTDMVVLELGASSGLISRRINRKSPKKHIIIEQSPSLKPYILKRLGRDNEVIFIHDEHMGSRIHPHVKYADEVFSFGILSDLHDEEIYLKQLASIMPEHGRIHFVDYVDIYKIIPNKEFLADIEKLKSVFHKAGFAISVTKKKGFLWNYLIINGIKTRDKGAVFV